MNIGLKKFPELMKKHIICNAEIGKMRKTDCTIASAIIEHTDNPLLLIKKILKTTKKIVIIISSFANQANTELTTYNAKKPIYQNTFSFNKIKKIFNKNKFSVSYILDEATNYSTKEKKVSQKKKCFFTLC